jgi:hypothetical protein
VRRAAAAVLALAVSCGGHDGREPDAWVADVCSGLTGWIAELQDLTATYGQDLARLQAGTGGPERVAARVKDRTLVFIDEGVAAGERLIDRIGEAGVPAVEDGREVVRTFERGIAEMRDAFAGLRGGLRSAEAPAEVQAQLARFSQIFTEAGERIRAIFREAEERQLGGAELAEAFDAEPECSGLRA